MYKRQGTELRARFASTGTSDSSGADGAGWGDRQGSEGGLAAMPRGIQSGVVFSKAGAEDGCTLLHDSFQGTLLMSGPTELKAMQV